MNSYVFIEKVKVIKITLIFDQKALQEAKELYENVKITASQQQILHMLASKMAEFIPVDIMPLKGFALKGAKEWQIKNEILTEELEHLTPQQRIDFMVFTLNKMKEYLIYILKNKENKGHIEEGMQATLDFYKQAFAQR